MLLGFVSIENRWIRTYFKGFCTNARRLSGDVEGMVLLSWQAQKRPNSAFQLSALSIGGKVT